jgi:hypothetical protein
VFDCRGALFGGRRGPVAFVDLAETKAFSERCLGSSEAGANSFACFRVFASILDLSVSMVGSVPAR